LRVQGLELKVGMPGRGSGPRVPDMELQVVCLRGMGEPARAPLGMAEEESPQVWFEDYVEVWFDRCLRTLEFLTVAGLAIVVTAGAIYEICWILWGHFPPDRQSRMRDALNMLNGNWKVGLLLLIPLFYRTVRAFLQRAEEFAGIKAPRQPVTTHTGRLKPSSQDNSPSTGG